jgi:uncharacterized membrane protein
MKTQEKHGGAQGSNLRDPARVIALSDGVFAIVLTILVLDLEVPELEPGQSLGSALVGLGPTFVAYVISFFMTGMYWVWHRDLFAGVRHVDRAVVWLNLLFLLPASLIPFAASFLGSYGHKPAALHAYGVLLITLAALRSLFRGYLMHRPELLWKAPSRRSRRLAHALTAGLVVLNGVAILAANHVPGMSLTIFASVPVLYFLAVTLLRSRAGTRQAAEDFS